MARQHGKDQGIERERRGEHVEPFASARWHDAVRSDRLRHAGDLYLGRRSVATAAGEEWLHVVVVSSESGTT